MKHTFFDIFIINRCCHFHTPCGISGHKVCRGNIYLIMSENIDSGMFQVTSHNTAYSNMICRSRNSCNQTAASAHDQLNIHTSLRRFHQFLNNPFICQGVHLCTNISGFSAFCQCNLLIHFRKNLVTQTFRCNHQIFGFLHHLTETKFVEYFICFCANPLMRCQQWEICI